MGAKAENLNGVIGNQDLDLNLESASSHTMTRRVEGAFKTDVLQFRTIAKESPAEDFR